MNQPISPAGSSNRITLSFWHVKAPSMTGMTMTELSRDGYEQCMYMPRLAALYTVDAH